MTQDLSSLVCEVERIVTAPYIPSLQDLYGLVQNSKLSAIKCWAIQKPCQVGLLADVLVEGLSRSRVALPLLSSFASATSFRDAVLLRHPVILDGLLQKAVDSGGREFFTACVSLLSAPFPSGLVPPARLSDLITLLVSDMARNPSTETISTLHTLMNGLQAYSLYEMSTEVMSNLQIEFTKTLRNLDDHMGILLCLATFAKIASTQSIDASGKHKEPDWLLNIRHFFGSKRGMKTLDLVVLRVILACSSNNNKLTPSQAAESIGLAICIANAIQQDQKQAWLSVSSSKIAKLCEKVTRDGLDREVQMMGVAFLLTLRPAANFSCHIRELGLHVLVSKGSKGVMGLMPHYLIPRVAQSLADSEESAIYHLLRFVYEAVQAGGLPTQNSLSDLRLAQLILEGFQASQSAALASAMLDSVSTKEMIFNLLKSFPIGSHQKTCEGELACSSTRTALQNKVLASLFEVYFSATLARNGNNAEALVMKSFLDQAATSSFKNDCTFFVSDLNGFRRSISLRGEKEFAAQPPSRDWQSGVIETMMQNAQGSRDLIMKKIQSVCVDLESRCYDVEGPLRFAEEERDRHIFESEQLKIQKADVERQLEASSKGISELQESLAQLEEHATNACSRVEELSASLESARQELEEQRRHSDATLQREMEMARGRELELVATCTGKDDQLEEAQESLLALQCENQEMRQNLEGLLKDQAGSLESSMSLRHELAESKRLLESKNELCSEKEDEIQRLLTENLEMQKEISNMKGTMNEENTKSEQLRAALQDAESKYQSDMRATNDKHEKEASKMTSEIKQREDQLKKVNFSMQQAAQHASAELQSKDKRIHQLERKIQSLRDERATKAREFSEAQQHIGRLMNVMGFNANAPGPDPSTQQDHQAPSEQGIRRGTRRSSIYDDEAELVESFDELASQVRGPSPKRPKANTHGSTRNPSKSPRVGATGHSGSSSPSSAALSSRQPLGQTNPNSSRKEQLSQAPKSLEHGNENHLQGIDLDMDLEFSKDFLFSSTAFSGSNDQPVP